MSLKQCSLFMIIKINFIAIIIDLFLKDNNELEQSRKQLAKDWNFFNSVSINLLKCIQYIQNVI